MNLLLSCTDEPFIYMVVVMILLFMRSHWTQLIAQNLSHLIHKVGTLDAIQNGHRSPTFRILLQPPHSDISYTLATAFTKPEIDEHWNFLMIDLLPKLGVYPQRVILLSISQTLCSKCIESFDSSEDLRVYVVGKVESLVATAEQQDDSDPVGATPQC